MATRIMVAGVDIPLEIVSRLSAGEPTIFEHGLSEYLHRNVRAGRLQFTTEAGPAIADAEVIFIAVGTPEAPDGSADLSQIQSVVISNPEFLRERRTTQDFFHPNRIVVGFDDPDSSGAGRAREILKDLYRPLYLISTPFVWTTLEAAELIKYASNAFLATKITFINHILAEAVGADIHVVAKTMGMDGRISPKFLHLGPVYGGSCFPKDTKAVVSTGDRHGVEMTLLKAVVSGNEAQKEHTAAKIRRLLGGSAPARLWRSSGSHSRLKPRTFASRLPSPLCGISCKPAQPSTSTTPKLSTISGRSSPTRLPTSTTSLSVSPALTAR